jgi:hypothetical protein
MRNKTVKRTNKGKRRLDTIRHYGHSSYTEFVLYKKAIDVMLAKIAKVK